MRLLHESAVVGFAGGDDGVLVALLHPLDGLAVEGRDIGFELLLLGIGAGLGLLGPQSQQFLGDLSLLLRCHRAQIEGKVVLLVVVVTGFSDGGFRLVAMFRGVLGQNGSNAVFRREIVILGESVVGGVGWFRVGGS